MKYSALAAGICTLLACSSPEPAAEVVWANVADVLTTDSTGTEVTVGVFGGSGKERNRPVTVKGGSLQAVPDGLQVNFTEAGWLSLAPGALGLPAGWAAFDELVILATGSGRVVVQVYGSRSRLTDTVSFSPEGAEVRIDIREVPLLGGLEGQVQKLAFLVDAPMELVLNRLGLVPATAQGPLVDAFGQRVLADWPGKVGSVQQLRVDPSDTLLQQFAPGRAQDQYGGYLDHSLELQATGFFHTQFAQGRWYLVTPEGNPFYSYGVNGVRRRSFDSNAGLTQVEGRRHLFEQLPPYGECPACFREDSAYLSFYCYNVYRKYSGDFTAWRDHTVDRLRAIGFNTIGNWSDTLMHNVPMAYTYTLNSRQAGGVRATHSLPDVYHPEWEHRLDSAFAHIAHRADDPYLLGYFVDNEMGWGGFDDLDTSSYTFAAIGHLPEEEKAAAFAEKYFATIDSIIAKHDPNHLYLGCRFTRRWDTHRIPALAAARYADIISLNMYAPPTEEEIDRWHQHTGKPMLIGEHHIPPKLPYALLPRYPAFEVSARNEMVRDYLQLWMRQPYAVGSHWYQWSDQDISGRAEGGEDQPVGIVTITDRVKAPLATVMNQMSHEIPTHLLEE